MSYIFSTATSLENRPEISAPLRLHHTINLTQPAPVKTRQKQKKSKRTF